MKFSEGLLRSTPEAKAGLLVDDAFLRGIMWGLTLSSLLWIALGVLIAII
jgi:hypothetical protein